MKKQIIVLLFSLTFTLSSCGFFRSIGLYNTPPAYADTFEEINGFPFIDHANKASNLVLELLTTQKVFSPYDSIKLKIKVFNCSLTDTMFIRGFHSSYYSQDLIVTDSSNHKMKIIEWEKWACPRVIIVDGYGRKIKHTLAPNGIKLAPKDSLLGTLAYKTGIKITPPGLSQILSIERENEPGIYQAYYIFEHEEYDNVNGPIEIKIKTDTVVYNVRNYTFEESEIRNEAVRIANEIDCSTNSFSADSLFESFISKYPESIYVEQLTEFLELKKSLLNHNEKF
jgi:hypothetical protein